MDTKRGGRAAGFRVGAAAVFMGALIPAIGRPADERAKQLLETCLQTQCRMDHVSLRCVSEMHGTHFEDKPNHQRQELLIRIDGERIDIKGRHELLDKRQELSCIYRKTSDNGFLVTYSHDIPVKRPNNGLARKLGSEGAAANLRAIRQDPASGNCLDGWAIIGDRRLAQQLVDAGTCKVARSEDVAGTRCQVVEGTTPLGTIVLWLAGDRGCVPLQFVLERVGEQIPAKERAWRTTPIIRIASQLDRVEAEKMGDTWVPVRGRLVDEFHLADGRFARAEHVYERSDIELSPDFSRTDAFSIDLPDGTIVTNLDDKASGVRYM